MKLFKTLAGPVVETMDGRVVLPALDWDALLNHDALAAFLSDALRTSGRPIDRGATCPASIAAPIGSQEVWAAGVTYLRSKVARMEESETASGGDFYDRVYSADRPELFFKATPHRVMGPGQAVRIRRDSNWNVPEPELVLVVNARGNIIGYTIGNDMSSRDIEGANPLYLPQAKVYDGCCALGPCILITEEPLPRETEVRLIIRRGEAEAFAGSTSLGQMKRGFEELVSWLLRDNRFPAGCFLMTGTGIVPPDEFTLQSADQISITIEPIGTLVNTVA